MAKSPISAERKFDKRVGKLGGSRTDLAGPVSRLLPELISVARLAFEVQYNHGFAKRWFASDARGTADRESKLSSNCYHRGRLAMRRFSRVVCCVCCVCLFLLGGTVDAERSKSDKQADELLRALPVVGPAERPSTDYLIDAAPFLARAFRSDDSKELILDNGLVRRKWRIAPNGACVGYDNLMSGQTMLRSVRPEARVTIDGVAYDVGGLTGQPNHAYLTPGWLDAMEADPKAMQLVGFEIGEPAERFAWGRRRHAAPDAVWPPQGVYLRMDYAVPKKTSPIRVSVHYELYDGVPVMSKWVTVDNHTDAEIRIDRFTGEELAIVEQSSWTEFREGVAHPRPDYLHVETDFAFGGMNPTNANRHVVHWREDPLYSSQVNWARRTPCLLVCEPTYGPDQRIAPGESFEGFRVFELVYANANREHQGMAYRRMYRIIAPWVTENPITHHLLTHDPKRAREAIDMAAEVGFEAIIFSFGSGFDMENRDAAFLDQWKQVADYADGKGIELGSYSLLSSRGVGAEHMSVLPPGVDATHGKIPSLASEWGQQWLQTVRGFYEETGFDQFENDGPYPGDVDITSRPPIQYGVDDSRWALWQQNTWLYRGLRADGVYINQPDYHFLNGGNKSGMGYREVNWSLPRAQQAIHTRQNIFDGTWGKTPSMGWMHVPLSQYHGGGAEATIEPLREHLDHYERMMRSNLGMGVQAHYRGPRLFDTNETRDMVKRTIDWFKQHRDILESEWMEENETIDALYKMLTSRGGLTNAEASGLVQAWKRQFLETNGTRLLARINQALYNQLCPINIRPTPGELSRVGLVLFELGEFGPDWNPNVPAADGNLLTSRTDRVAEDIVIRTDAKVRALLQKRRAFGPEQFELLPRLDFANDPESHRFLFGYLVGSEAFYSLCGSSEFHDELQDLTGNQQVRIELIDTFARYRRSWTSAGDHARIETFLDIAGQLVENGMEIPKEAAQRLAILIATQENPVNGNATHLFASLCAEIEPKISSLLTESSEHQQLLSVIERAIKDELECYANDSGIKARLLSPSGASHLLQKALEQAVDLVKTTPIDDRRPGRPLLIATWIAAYVHHDDIERLPILHFGVTF